MEAFPLTVQDDFFADPDKILEYAKSLEYNRDPDGKWPGLRTQALGDINQDFSYSVGAKILSAYFPDAKKSIPFKASANFQKIPAGEYTTGRIHSDAPALATAIIYLSPNGNMDTGTSLYRIKKDLVGLNIKAETNYKEEKKEEIIQKYNSQFEETAKVGGYYNRLFLFDSNEYHGANDYNIPSGEDRYTLVYFFFDMLYQPIYPSMRIKRVLV